MEIHQSEQSLSRFAVPNRACAKYDTLTVMKLQVLRFDKAVLSALQSNNVASLL